MLSRAASLKQAFFGQHVPFFDQHAVAKQTPWSADSASFAYVDQDGQLFVQHLDEPGEPEVVSAGLPASDVAWWSPC